MSNRRQDKPVPRPGMQLGPYPENRASLGNWLDRVAARLGGNVQVKSRYHSLRMRRFVKRVGAYRAALEGASDAELKDRIQALRSRLQRDGLADGPCAEAFAIIREVAGRSLGKRHYDVQLMGGWVIVQGMLAEMETGEGKTLTATLPACTAALAGIPVHVITVNDYLVSRDADNMAPLYDYLGISVGTIIEGMDMPVRKAAYACDITYATNKQIAFDYLRDRIALRGMTSQLALRTERLCRKQTRLDGLLMRGLCFAIVDEADSVLIDEACTPLIISQPSAAEEQAAAVYREALELSESLSENADFMVHKTRRAVELTDKGCALLTDLARNLGKHWSLRTRREELVSQALAARLLYHRDVEYIVNEGKVQIIDESTGRVMADRSWQSGLHQMVETKEGCELTAPLEPLARISYQRFFTRYYHLAGMTGTAREAAGELQDIYGLRVVKIPTHHPSQLTPLADRIFQHPEAKWEAVVARIRELRQQQRPVLVGTRSVADSEHLSELLTGLGLPHQVLNARQNRQEAAIVACAGQPGRITIATNMAGRGTDIPLAPGVAETGGLHVIAMERNTTRRVDRQLFGRCARQGSPGSFESILSLEDEIIARYFPKFLLRPAVKWMRGTSPLARRINRALLVTCQLKAERQQRHQRRGLEKTEDYLGRMLAFTGQGE